MHIVRHDGSYRCGGNHRSRHSGDILPLDFVIRSLASVTPNGGCMVRVVPTTTPLNMEPHAVVPESETKCFSRRPLKC